MASAKDFVTCEALAHIKQEDCVWGALADLRVKSEDCERRISGFKEEESEGENVGISVEDLKNASVRVKPQNPENGNGFKQEIPEESHCSSQLWFTNTGQLATQRNSLKVKSELSKFEENITDAEEEQKSPRSVQTNLHENGSFSPSSHPQTSFECRRQPKQDDKKMKKSTRGLEGLTAASLQCSSVTAANQVNTEAIDTDQQEMRNTDQETLYAYRECRKFLKNANDCKEHELNHTRQNPYSCSECGKLLSCRGSLRKHKRIHTGEKPYCCIECGKRFSDSSTHHKHMRIHTGEKPHCCPECGKQFSQINSLKRHSRIHTGEKPYTCSECGKQFSHISNFQRHTKIHTGEKPLSCSECGKCFPDNQSVNRHMRIHTGEKPYGCSDCGKRFTDSSNLQNHTRIHTGEKPYGCSECGKIFSYFKNLKKHAKTHTAEKSPHCCSECGKIFLQTSQLKRHMRIHTAVLNVVNDS